MQLHALCAAGRRRLLFVLISRLRIAASSSESTVEAPCIDVPPVMFTFVFEAEGAGDEVRKVGFDFEVLKSEIRGPAAEGGGLGVGAWIATGLGCKVKALLGCVGGLEVEAEVDGMGFLVM